MEVYHPDIGSFTMNEEGGRYIAIVKEVVIPSGVFDVKIEIPEKEAKKLMEGYYVSEMS